MKKFYINILISLSSFGVARADVTFKAVPATDITQAIATLKQVEITRQNGTLSAWWPWTLKCGDLNKDGKPDVYVNFHSAVGGMLFWTSVDADGIRFTRDTQFDDPTQVGPLAWGNRKLPLENPPLFVDLDNNGWLDMVSMGDESGNKRGNVKNIGGWLSLVGKGPGLSSGSVADFNGDGLPDLYRTDRSYGKTTQQRRFLKPDWTWTIPPAVPLPTPAGLPEDIAAKLAALATNTSTTNRYGGPIFHEVDLNTDGRPDLIVQYANAYTDNATYRWVAYLVRNPEGVLEEKSFGIIGLDMSVGDFNGDGRVDIFTSQATGAGLFLQQPDGTYKNASPPNSAKTSISDFAKIKDSYGVGIRPIDLDKDGDLDLLVFNRRSSGGRVFQNDAGVYKQVLSFRHWDAEGFDVADMNGDGLLDIVTGGQPTDDDVMIYLNTSVPPPPPLPPPPTGRVTGPNTGTLGDTLTFTAETTGTGTLTYAWDFGDGSLAQGPSASHAYASAGEFIVRLTVTDPLGQTGYGEFSLRVNYPPAPVVSLGEDLTGLTGQPIHFSVTVSGTTPLLYQWDFGDGNVSFGEPVHTYQAAGSFTASLTVVDPYGQTASDELTVIIAKPVPARGTRLPVPSEDAASPAFARLKAMADKGTVSRTVLSYVYKLTHDRKYADAAVASLTTYLNDADAAIALGNAPAICRDQYLYVGSELSSLSAVYDWCHDVITPELSKRTEDFSERVLSNLWDPKNARWGDKLCPWPGWGTDKPTNNYHFSFMRATTAWALVSQNSTWLDFLQDVKFPQVAAALAPYAAGGSNEGTGYGPAIRYLFESYRWWLASGRTLPPECLANARGWIDYWLHATTPDFTRFAPFGDQSRDPQAKQFDYHRQMILEAIKLSPDSDEAKRGRWWLAKAIPGMVREENALFDVLADNGPAEAPTVTWYTSPGVGHTFWRNSWDVNASYLAVSYGTMRADHDHGDKGSFFLWKGHWQTVTANIFSTSGIKDVPAVQNSMRFDRNGAALPQKFRLAPEATVQADAAGLSVEMDLSPVYATPGLTWKRSLVFDGRVLSLTDDCVTPEDIQSVWQMQLVDEPVMAGPAAFGTEDFSVWLDSSLAKEDWKLTTDYKCGWKVSASGQNKFSAKIILK